MHWLTSRAQLRSTLKNTECLAHLRHVAADGGAVRARARVLPVVAKRIANPEQRHLIIWQRLDRHPQPVVQIGAGRLRDVDQVGVQHLRTTRAELQEEAGSAAVLGCAESRVATMDTDKLRARRCTSSECTYAHG